MATTTNMPFAKNECFSEDDPDSRREVPVICALLEASRSPGWLLSPTSAGQIMPHTRQLSKEQKTDLRKVKKRELSRCRGARARQFHKCGPKPILLRPAVTIHRRNRAGNGERNQRDHRKCENHYNQGSPLLERVLEGQGGFQTQPLSFQLHAPGASKILPPDEDNCRPERTS